MLVPWMDVDAALAEMDAFSRQVEALLGQRGLDGRHGLRAWDGPSATLIEGRDGVARWTADLPGVDRKDLTIQVENGTLTVEVKRETAVPEGWSRRHSERSPFELRRSLRLPEDIDTDAIGASFDHGVLTISLPRRPRVTRTIQIQNA